MEKRAITMRCNKKQFKAIKPKLEGKVMFRDLSKFSDRLDFYLINHLGNIGNVTNVTCPRKEEGIYFFEEWNEKVFLKACGIKVKEPKEKTYKITREQIKEVYGYCNSTELQNTVKGWFPEVLETKLTAGKWYINNNGSLFFALCTEEEYISGYGFIDGVWRGELKRYFSRTGSKEATEQEVTEALTKEAVKRGYKNGNYNCLFLPKLTHKVVENFHYRKEDDTLYQGENQDSKNNAVYSKGKWAEIIPTITIPEAEAKLKEIGVNAKIV